jgi:hypothetical protein
MSSKFDGIYLENYLAMVFSLGEVKVQLPFI